MNPYRSWRLAIFVVVLCVTVAYFLFLAWSVIASLASVDS